MKTRYAVRDAIRSLMADPEYGFRAQFQALAPEYGLTELPAIDWNPGSANFAQINLAPAEVDKSILREYPACLLYTSLSAAPGRAVRFNRYSGEIIAHLDFYRWTGWRVEGEPNLEGEDTESAADCYEMAVYQVMARRDVPWSTFGVTYDSNLVVDRSKTIDLFGDGYRQVIPIQLVFAVDID